MADQFQWPDLSENYPEVAENDPQLDFKKELYRQKLELIKATQEARIAQEKAKADAWIAQEKAALDAQIARARARLDSELRRADMKVQAEINAEAAKTTALMEQNKAAWANEHAINQAYHAAYIDVATRQIDRASSKADFVQKAAAAIGTAYVGILALTIAIDTLSKQASGSASPISTGLPARGIAPTLFLGLAILLATAYRANLGNVSNRESSNGTVDGLQRARRDTFLLWAGAINPVRRYMLLAAFYSLGAGVVFLPAAYLAIQESDLLFYAIVAAVAVFALPLLVMLAEWLSRKGKSDTDERSPVV